MLSVLLAAGTLLFGCGGSSTSSADDDRIVAGVNLTELFKAPNETERLAVIADWNTRATAATDVASVTQSSVSLGGTAATVRIVSHSVGNATHYGAVVSPDNATPGTLPIVVYLHGGDDGVDVSELLSVLPVALASNQDDFVYVVPSFRSEQLHYNGATYTSTGDPSPWDLDVDDALSLVKAAVSVTAAADPDRVGVVGFSRGACVAMLMGIRDANIDVVIEFFGPTDFYSPWSEDLFADALDGTLHDLPGLSTLNTQVIQPLKNGSLTNAQARLEMLRRSPTYFVDLFPPTQVHHGTLDSVVPVSEAQLLRDAFVAGGLTAPDFPVYLYSGGSHNPLTLLGSFERAREFLNRLSNPALSTTEERAARE